MKKLLLLFLLLPGLLFSKTLISISFDGWVFEDSLNFSKSNGNIPFTYFLSAPYIITGCEIQNYNKSNFTYLPWRPDTIWSTNRIIQRIKLVDQAIRQGHEIGSHAVGHFKGSTWTYNEWKHELIFFKKIIDSRIKAYHLEKRNLKFGMEYIKSFRAPELSVNSNMYRALKDCGYLYDSSQCHSFQSYMKNKIPVFPLTIIKYGNKVSILAMDYNFFLMHSNALEVSNQALCDQYENDYYNSLVNHLTNNLGKPFIIGNHGSMWNKSAYFKALKRFILFSRRYDVEFVTFRDLYSIYK